MLYVVATMLPILIRLTIGHAYWINRQLALLVCIGFFVLSGTRWEVGCDWFSYSQIYEVASQSTHQAINFYEPLWKTLIGFLSKHQFSFVWVNILTSLIFFWGTWRLVRLQPDPLSCLAYLFPVLVINMPMSGIRQAAAIGLISIAFVCFKRKKRIAFLLSVSAATGFHGSAIVFLALLPLVGRKLSVLRLIGLGLLLLPFMPLLATLEAVEVGVGRYVGTGYDAAGAIFRCGFGGLVGVYFFIFLDKAWKRVSPEDYNLAYLGSLMLLACVPLVFVSSVVADRFAYYLIPLQAMIVVRASFLLKGRHSYVLAVLPYIGLLAMFALWALVSHHFSSCYIPYRSVLFI